MVLLAGAKFVLTWCFFRALSWCSPYVSVLVLDFWKKNVAPSWCKMCAHLVFFSQIDASSWCKMCARLVL
jgi:hypothetical protein